MFEGSFILYGMTGNLGVTRLLPALYELARKNKISNYAIIGAAYDEIDLADFLEKQVRPHIKTLDKDLWKTFCERIRYQKLDFSKAAGFALLHNLVEKCEAEYTFAHANRLLYCASPPQFFEAITQHSVKADIINKGMTGKNGGTWQRIVYEKPFGLDSVMAHDINNCIEALLDGRQAFRIDHYLLHDIVNNILHVRFANLMFEALWSQKYIDHVQIIMNEEHCLEGRLIFQQFGIIKDVVQSHLLQLLSLITMERPGCFEGDAVRTSKSRVLYDVRLVDGVLGQCEGCQDEGKFPGDQIIETFAALEFEVTSERWRDVPFFVKTGKCLHEKKTVVHIVFKKVPCFEGKDNVPLPNVLTLKIVPDDGFGLKLNVRERGVAKGTRQVDMEYCHNCEIDAYTQEAYEAVLLQVIQGNRLISVRRDEICREWDITQAILDKQLPFFRYKKGSKGPGAADEFIKKRNRDWIE